MRTLTSLFFFGFLLLIPSSASQDNPQLPNFKAWKKTKECRGELVLCDRKEKTALKDVHYEKDGVGGVYHTVSLLYNLENQPWLLFYDVHCQDPDEKPTSFYVWEAKYSRFLFWRKLKWKFIGEMAEKIESNGMEEFFHKKYNIRAP